MATLRPLITVALAVLLAACAAPGNQADGVATADVPPAATDADAGGAPTVHRGPVRDSIPAAPTLGGAAAAGGVEIDRSCTTDADCTVKNVGNCCGHYPACVNVDSPTDPEGVRARCAAEGRVGVCGFPEIAGCQCVQGSCQASRKEAMLE